MSLFRTKPIVQALADGGDEAHSLKKTLTAIDLTALGIGAIIGAGIFAVLGSATSGGTGQPPAGPGVTLSIVLTALVCGFCALCYAEFASTVPVAGSAYTYSYVTLGELPAWILGWDLILEYAVGNSAVAISWAAYFRQLLMGIGLEIPAWLAADIRSAGLAAKAAAESGVSSLGPEALVAYQAWNDHAEIFGIQIVFNILAVTAFVTWILVVGVTGMIRYTKLAGSADPLAVALDHANQHWAAGILAFGAVLAMTAVLLVFQMGQPRILMTMSRDGLLGPWFSRIHPRYRTPHATTILTGVFVAFFSAVANIDVIVQLTNIGTLFAFVMVCIGILVLRVREPNLPRKFKVPFVPWVPLMGIGMCLVLMAGLPLFTWIGFGLWIGVGLVIYFLYGIRHSRLRGRA